MKTTLPGWFDKRARLRQLDEYVDRTDQAMFGFREMPTEEKEHWASSLPTISTAASS